MTKMQVPKGGGRALEKGSTPNVDSGMLKVLKLDGYYVLHPENMSLLGK